LFSIAELQEKDRQIMNFLIMRSRIVDSMREERPNMWMMNHFEGKDSVLSSIATACHVHPQFFLSLTLTTFKPHLFKYFNSSYRKFNE